MHTVNVSLKYDHATRPHGSTSLDVSPFRYCCGEQSDSDLAVAPRSCASLRLLTYLHIVDWGGMMRFVQTQRPAQQPHQMCTVQTFCGFGKSYPAHSTERSAPSSCLAPAGRLSRAVHCLPAARTTWIHFGFRAMCTVRTSSYTNARCAGQHHWGTCNNAASF